MRRIRRAPSASRAPFADLIVSCAAGGAVLLMSTPLPLWPSVPQPTCGGRFGGRGTTEGRRGGTGLAGAVAGAGMGSLAGALATAGASGVAAPVSAVAASAVAVSGAVSAVAVSAVAAFAIGCAGDLPCVPPHAATAVRRAICQVAVRTRSVSWECTVRARAFRSERRPCARAAPRFARS